MTSVFVAASRQHVGKSSSCLGIVNACVGRFGKCGFIKPVGQRTVPVLGNDGAEIRVDKDVKLMREFFNIEDEYASMSPVVVPSGYTKKYIDGVITVREGGDDRPSGKTMNSISRTRARARAVSRQPSVLRQPWYTYQTILFFT